MAMDRAGRFKPLSGARSSSALQKGEAERIRPARRFFSAKPGERSF
jgi:hypothetical protein